MRQGKKNKYLNGVLPMFLITFSIGAVYCWTLFKEHVNEYTGFGKPVTEWCFSLAIFFLGMSAAFGGRLVEKNPRKSAFLTFVFFTAGWVATGLGIQLKNPLVTVLGFGVIQGVGLGLGYITPVKTLMIWFADKKGFAAGLCIAGFGIAGVIANPIIGALLQSGMTVYMVFYSLAAIYAVALFIASRLIWRPEIEAAPEAAPFHAGTVIFHRKFILLWLVIFLNISCGLALISQEKQIYNSIGLAGLTPLIVLLCSINAVSNVAGRLALASWQDRLAAKHIPYYIMAVMSLAVCCVAAMSPGLLATTFAMIFVVQFFFGVGFGCMPNIIHQNYGIHRLSTVHGLFLSAWGVAGLAGNQFASYILAHYDRGILYTVLGGLYALMLAILLWWGRVPCKHGTI